MMLFNSLILSDQLTSVISKACCSNLFRSYACSTLYIPINQVTHKYNNKIGSALFQVSAAKQMRNPFFWVITQRVVVIPYRRFGITYKSHLLGSKAKQKKILTPEYWADRLSRNVCKELAFLLRNNTVLNICSFVVEPE